MEEELRVPSVDERAQGPYIEAEELTLTTALGPVYEDVTASIPKGVTCCVFGEHGSGKTSLLLSLCGRMKFKSGSATVGKYNLPKQFRLVRRNSGLALIPGVNDVQSFLPIKDIAAAELSLVGKNGNKEKTAVYLEDWGFLDKADVKFKDLNIYDTCIFGIVLAMCGDPDLLVVDDIQTELTQYQSIKIMKYLKEISAKRGVTVLVGCSEYEIARQADCLIVMDEAAEAQRRAVIRGLDVSPNELCPVVGSGNHVDVYNYAAGKTKTAASEGRA